MIANNFIMIIIVNAGTYTHDFFNQLLVYLISYKEGNFGSGHGPLGSPWVRP